MGRGLNLRQTPVSRESGYLGENPVSGEVAKKSFHFGLRVAIAFLGRRSDAPADDASGFLGTGLTSQKLAVHQIGRYVVAVSLEQQAELRIRGGHISAVHAFER